jgi:hypothetical protein
MWDEPLAATAREIDAYTIVVSVSDARAIEVARVLCGYNALARSGVFGEMQIVDANGGARQRLRALVLLVREALRFAAGAGLTNVLTEAPERLAPFATRMSGIDAQPIGGRRLFAGELHVVRSVALRESDDAGNLATPLDARAAADAADAADQAAIGGGIDATIDLPR